MVDIFSAFTGSLIFLLLVWVSLTSIAERELKAAGRFIVLAILILSPYVLLHFLKFPGAVLLQWGFIGLPYLFGLSLLIPFKPIGYGSRAIPNPGQDERDTMFSRKDLIPGTETYDAYYQHKPENKKPDNGFRANPGLLQPGSVYFNRAAFAAANASFQTVEQLHPMASSVMPARREQDNKIMITGFIRNWGGKLGALEVGFTRLKDYHFYTVGGRRERYGKMIKNDHQYAIVCTVEMDHTMMASAPAAPTVMESAQQYLSSGIIAVQIAEFIRNLGYSARAHIDANYELICPIVARDAGLGEIGRMGLLMTTRHGPRVRIAVVTTDLPMEIDKPSHEPYILDFCTRCKKCAEACPAQAISFDNRAPVEGVMRWKINAEACYTYWTKTGTDCGRCVIVCPFSHPDTLLHLLVRKGVRNSVLFSKLAIHLDHLIYGKKPEPKKVPAWIPTRIREK